jgi:TMEM175 potassium channel family protein
MLAMTKTRLEAFSDGVFAIVITLLVIELHVPEVGEGESLARALWHQWPSYAGYLVSFAVVGVIWLNHHRVFDQIVRVDRPVMLLNLLLLLWVALIPFPTNVVATYLRDGGEPASTALAVYGGVMLAFFAFFGALYAWITHDERLLGALPPAAELRRARLRFMIGSAFYVIAFALSWVWAPLALALHGAMALYYAFDQASIASDEPQAVSVG